MQMSTLHSVEEELHGIDPDDLREMAYQAARSHVQLCRLTSKVGDCSHIEAEAIRDRVDALNIGELVALIAPTAWLSIDLHQRIG